MYLIILFILSFVGSCFNFNNVNFKVNSNKIQFLTSNDKFLKKSIQLSNNYFNNSLNNYKDYKEDNYKRKLVLGNTLLINNNLRNKRVLSIDFNNGSVSISYNFNNYFELLGSFKFTNYYQLTLKIIRLILSYDNYTNNNKDDYIGNNKDNKKRDEDDNLVILMGIPFNYTNDSFYSNLYGFTNDNYRLLFQILYILDYSSYLSYFLNYFINNSLNNLDNSLNNPDNYNNSLNNYKSDKDEKDENNLWVNSYCLYCSLIYNNSFNNSLNNYEKDNKNKKCLLNDKINCKNSINLNKMNYLVLGISEQLSSYQTSSLSSLNSSFINNNIKNSFVDLKINKYKKDMLSTLNIYYNFINSFNNNSNNYKDNKDNEQGNVVILPNCNAIFDADKSHNLLLFNKIKNLFHFYIHFK